MLCDEIISPLEAKVVRKDLMGNIVSDEELERMDEVDADKALDEQESLRHFYRSLRTYVGDKAKALADLRDRYGLPRQDEPPEMEGMDGSQLDLYYPSKLLQALQS